jgi:hypothetical protein
MATFAERDRDLTAAAVYHALAAGFSAGAPARDAAAASAALLAGMDESDRDFVQQRIIDLEGAIRAGRT